MPAPPKSASPPMTIDTRLIEACPFCGGEAQVMIGVRGDHGFAVQCSRSYCRASTRGHPTEQRAIERWNTRSPVVGQGGEREEAERLRAALVAARDFLMSAPLESGVCCCGDKIEHHNIGSGHSPVDMLSYAADQEVERIDAVLKSASPQ